MTDEEKQFHEKRIAHIFHSDGSEALPFMGFSMLIHWPIYYLSKEEAEAMYPSENTDDR